MRIGEIAIIGPEFENKQVFIKTVCNKIEIQNDALIFSRLPINSQLVVHLYGLNLSENNLNMTLDLISKKLLGYIVLFNWNIPDSYSSVKSMVDFITTRYNIPMVIAANLVNEANPVPKELLNVGFSIADHGHFTFCRISEPKSTKRVLITLINTVIERLNGN